MSLLENLQSQVKKITEEESKKSGNFLEQEAFYENHLKHVMVRVHNYFEKIVENLNIVAPDIYPSYPLNPMERKGVTLEQADYAYSYDNGRHPRQIDILTICNLKRPIEFYVPTADAVLNHSNLLESYQFPHHRKIKLDKLYNICGATFILEGPMKAQIRISANSSEKCIDVFLWNIEKKPFRKYRFSPEKVDDQLLQRLARMLIRKESVLTS